MKTIPWDFRFGLATKREPGAYFPPLPYSPFPPLPLPARRRKVPPVAQTTRWTAAMQHRTRLILRRILLLAAVLIVAVMGYLMHVPITEPVPALVKLRIPYFDKIVHFSLYLLLSLSLCGWLWLGRVPVLKQVLLLLMLLMGYSALEEWSQQFSLGRNSDVYDWLADVSGFTLGCVLVWSMIQFGPRTLRVTE